MISSSSAVLCFRFGKIICFFLSLLNSLSFLVNPIYNSEQFQVVMEVQTDDRLRTLEFLSIDAVHLRQIACRNRCQIITFIKQALFPEESVLLDETDLPSVPQIQRLVMKYVIVGRKEVQLNSSLRHQVQCSRLLILEINRLASLEAFFFEHTVKVLDFLLAELREAGLEELDAFLLLFDRVPHEFVEGFFIQCQNANWVQCDERGISGLTGAYLGACSRRAASPTTSPGFLLKRWKYVSWWSL